MDPHAGNYPSLSPYTYVANNPLIAIDPDGRDIWFVHGTFSSWETWIKGGENYTANWSKALNDDIGGLFSWKYGSFTNSRLSRYIAARRLVRQIEKAYNENPEMLVQLVAHSHGGNVAILAANLLKKRGISVDRLVLLGTPSRGDYRLKEGAVDELINTSIDDDIWQVAGGFDFGPTTRLGRPAGRHSHQR